MPKESDILRHVEVGQTNCWNCSLVLVLQDYQFWQSLFQSWAHVQHQVIFTHNVLHRQIGAMGALMPILREIQEFLLHQVFYTIQNIPFLVLVLEGMPSRIGCTGFATGGR